jgi:hypothetical protein
MIRDAFHRLGPRPCDREDRPFRAGSSALSRPSAPFRVLQTTRRRPTDAGSRLTLPRHSKATRFTRLRARCAVIPRDERGRCSSPTSATDSSTRAPASWIVRSPRRASAFAARALRRGKPRRRARVGGRLTTLHRASRGSGSTLRPWLSARFRERAAALRAPSVPGGESIESPRAAPPVRAAFSSARRVSTPLSDALTARDGAPHEVTRVSSARDRLPPHLVKGAASSDLRTPSIDECPLGPALAHRTSNADPPPAAGFATGRRASDAPSPARPGGEWARPRRYRGLFTRGRSWPRAVRRLLPSKRSASTTIGPSNPVTATPAACLRRQRDRRRRSAVFSSSTPA